MRKQEIINSLMKNIADYSLEPFYQELLVKALYYYTLSTNDSPELENIESLNEFIDILDYRFKDELEDVKEEFKTIVQEYENYHNFEIN